MAGTYRDGAALALAREAVPVPGEFGTFPYRTPIIGECTKLDGLLNLRRPPRIPAEPALQSLGRIGIPLQHVLQNCRLAGPVVGHDATSKHQRCRIDPLHD